MKTKISEALLKAQHDASFLCDNLRHAYTKSNGLESLFLLPMIKEANELRSKIGNIINAINSSGE